MGEFFTAGPTGGLQITRRVGEAFLADGPVRVIVLRVKGGQVLLRIQADKATKILREELSEKGAL